MKNKMKSSKMLKKADALKGFLGSMSKKKGEMGMGMTPPSNKITSSQSKNLGVATGTPYKTTATPSDKINTVRSSFNSPPRNSAEINAYMQNRPKPAMKPSMKKGGNLPDFSGDGKITQKDVLMGRGIIPKPKAQMGMETLPKPGKVKTKTVIKSPDFNYRTVEKIKDVNSKSGNTGYTEKTKTRRTVKGMLEGVPKIKFNQERIMENPMEDKMFDKYLKASMKKGGMSRMANEGFKNAKRTITDGYKGTGAPNPLAAIVKNTAKKSKMGKKPKMQMGGNTGKIPKNYTTERYSADMINRMPSKNTPTDSATLNKSLNLLNSLTDSIGKKETMKKGKMKPKMGMGGSFFPMNPNTPMIATEKDFINKQSFKKGGMSKKKKK